jgi:hypothetical protein
VNRNGGMSRNKNWESILSFCWSKKAEVVLTYLAKSLMVGFNERKKRCMLVLLVSGWIEVMDVPFHTVKVHIFHILALNGVSAAAVSEIHVTEWKFDEENDVQCIHMKSIMK